MTRGGRLGKALVLVLAGMLGLWACSRNQTEDAARRSFYASLNPQRDFSLTGQDGGAFRLRDHRGQVVLLFFGYLSCPDICPSTLSKLSSAYARLDPGLRPRVLTVFVSFDTKRDTPRRIKEYLSYFKLNSVGLTGTQSQVDKVARAYKVAYVKHDTHSALGYLYDHTDSVFLIDPDGRVQDALAADETAASVADKIRRLLIERTGLPSPGA